MQRRHDRAAARHAASLLYLGVGPRARVCGRVSVWVCGCERVSVRLGGWWVGDASTVNTLPGKERGLFPDLGAHIGEALVGSDSILLHRCQYVRLLPPPCLVCNYTHTHVCMYVSVYACSYVRM